MTLRSSLNKPVIAKESLKARSKESILDSICDLKEEMQGLNSIKHITEAEDPTLKAEKNEENSKIDVKESKSAGNINLGEAMQDLLSSFLM